MCLLISSIRKYSTLCVPILICKMSRLRNTRAGSLKEEETMNLYRRQPGIRVGDKNKPKFAKLVKMGTLKDDTQIIVFGGFFVYVCVFFVSFRRDSFIFV